MGPGSGYGNYGGSNRANSTARTGYSAGTKNQSNNSFGSSWTSLGDGKYKYGNSSVIGMFDSNGNFSARATGTSWQDRQLVALLNDNSPLYASEISKLKESYMSTANKPKAESLSQSELERRTFLKEQRAAMLKNSKTAGDLFATSLMSKSSSLLGM